jgi:hypothetical protein
VDPRLVVLYDTLIISQCWQYECASRPDWGTIIRNLQQLRKMQLGLGGLRASDNAAVSATSSPVQPRREVVLLEIPWCELSFSPETDFIDEGEYGTVYKGRWRGNQLVAIKKLLIKTVGKRVAQEMQQEATCLCQMDHENVIQLVGVCFEAPNFALILHYAAPSLLTLLGDVETFPLGDQYLAATQIARGMEAIHAAGILHHDLRSCNVLMGEDRCCCIADFA